MGHYESGWEDVCWAEADTEPAPAPEEDTMTATEKEAVHHGKLLALMLEQLSEAARQYAHGACSLEQLQAAALGWAVVELERADGQR